MVGASGGAGWRACVVRAVVRRRVGGWGYEERAAGSRIEASGTLVSDSTTAVCGGWVRMGALLI